ncbi:hypothetical protein GCM10010452_40340 [Crossiella cryophila]
MFTIAAAPAAPVASAAPPPMCTVNGVLTTGTLLLGRVTINGTAGNDVIKCHATLAQNSEYPLTVNALGGDDDVFFGGVLLGDDGTKDIVNLGAGNDKFFAKLNTNVSDTRAANEGTINGGLGNDTIIVGDVPENANYGADGNGASGEVNGGDGNDTIIVNGGTLPEGNNFGNAGTVNGGTGADTISVRGGFRGIGYIGTPANVGTVNGGAGIDTITITGGYSDSRFSQEPGGAANGENDFDPDVDPTFGVVNGGLGVDKITLNGGVRYNFETETPAQGSNPGPSNVEEAIVDGGGALGLDGATCTFNPASQGTVTRCTP